MTHRTARIVRSRWRWSLLLTALLWPIVAASPAAAHLGLAASDPADGAQLVQPPRQITLTFTKTEQPVGGGWRLTTSDGVRLSTTADTADDGRTWRLRPAQPLPPGRYDLTWRVVAGDAHVRSGTLGFQVTGGPGARAPATQQSPGADAATAGRSPGNTAAHPSGHSSAAHAPGQSSHDGSATAAPLPAEPDGHPSHPEAGDAGGWTASVLGALGRWLSIVGILVAVGALIVALTTLVGSTGDVNLAQHLIRGAGLTVAVGGALEGGYLLLTLGSAVPAGAGACVLARLAGGGLLVTTTRLSARRAGGRRSQDVQVLPPEPVRARHGSTQLLLTPPIQVGRVRPVVTRPLPVTMACASLIGSFLLDGHTASVGPRPVMALADVVHTLGASVWAGGVVLLACLLLVRARAGVPTGAGELAVRFSVPASAAAAAVGIAGAGLLMLIIDEPSQLFSTPWGRVMVVKLALVTAVALLGYANNRYALPALDAWRPHTARMLRRTVAVEGCVMIAVLAVTATLIASGM
jgi:copper transport protein